MGTFTRRECESGPLRREARVTWTLRWGVALGHIRPKEGYGSGDKGPEVTEPRKHM